MNAAAADILRSRAVLMLQHAADLDGRCTDAPAVVRDLLGGFRIDYLNHEPEPVS